MTLSDVHPPLTVLMSVYNGVRFLSQAIVSILGQSFGDFEFLIVDDGSDDGSWEILQRHAGDARIRLIRQDNRGLAASLNRGLAEARSPLVARMDADDVARPHRLQTQIDFLRERPEIVLVGSAVEIID